MNSTWFDAVAQWLVAAPIAVQMLLLGAAVVPALTAVAWLVVYCVDQAGRIRMSVHGQGI